MENLKNVDWVYVMQPKDPNDKTAIDFIEQARFKYIREKR